MNPPASVIDLLEKHGQSHLLRWWPELNAAQRRVLLDDLAVLDLDRMAALQRDVANRTDHGSAGDRAARAQPPSALIRLPSRGGRSVEWSQAREHGEELLRQGCVAAILVAGGQGTRLGFDRPKGMFPIGPVSSKSLFQLMCEQLAARSRRAGKPIPYFIMTSRATHDETRRFFEQHAFFGLNRDDVYFFEQGLLPAVDAATGRVLMDQKWSVSHSPDGHGGLLRALDRSGMLDVMRERGIELLYYHQVDNPAAIIADPAFLGLHALHGSEVSTKVVAKVAAEERMGVVVAIDGRTEIIEYSDLPADRATARDGDGRLLLWAGNTAMHVFNRSFLERLARGGCQLPYHRAHKAVPYVDDHGRRITPEQPNAIKFEQFIFDALPLARSALVVEADRAREFLPVKNRDGNDSPETAREGLVRIYRSWLEAAGVDVPAGVQVEISPHVALDESELPARIPAGTRIDSDRVIE